MSPLNATEKPSGKIGMRSWGIFSLSRPLRVFIVTVDVVAIMSAALSLFAFTGSRHDIAIAVTLVVLSTIFEEASSRVDELRFRLNSGLHSDMTAVWIFAAAAVLSPALAFGVFAWVRLHLWIRHQRGAGGVGHRLFFSACTIWLAALGTHWAVGLYGPTGTLPGGALALAAIASGIAAYMIINVGLVFIAIVASTSRGARPPLRSLWSDNSLELATQCLAGLATVALCFAPWLIVMVMPAMAILQRSVLVKELEVAATTDAKTGLLNAVTWTQLAERELVRADREGHPVSLLIIDMDNFKLINDTYGHLAGDSVLKAVADVLLDEMRGYDTVGRFGGEEFVALLPRVSPLDALSVADRILGRIRALVVATKNEDRVPVTGMSASIGLSCYPFQGIDIEDLLHGADSALYTAKREGRDRVEYHHANRRDDVELHSD